MNLLAAILGFAVAIGVLVVVHEFGHYSVARLAGVKVLRFSIGFGRPLLQRRAANGTEWRIGWLPLGGYVKMLDERESETPIDAADLPRAFNRQPVAKRFAIVAAGPVANFILAILLFSAIFATGVTEPAAIVAAPPAGTALARAGLDSGATIVAVREADSDGVMGEPVPVRSWPDLRWKLFDAALDQRAVALQSTSDGVRGEHQLDLSGSHPDSVDQDFMTQLGFEPGGVSAVVATVEPGSPAQAAGLAVGDTIRAVDGQSVSDVRAFISHIQHSPKRTVTLSVERDGKLRAIPVVPAAAADAADGAVVGRIGAAIGERTPSVEVRYGPLEALRLGARRTWEISAFSLRMFGRMLVGEASLRNLSGPVTIADYAGKSARMGLSAFLSFLALVSISLGVLNLLPIPVLDGGHLLYYAVEAVTGRAVSERWQSILQRAGLVCIFALSAIALFNDVARLVHF